MVESSNKKKEFLRVNDFWYVSLFGGLDIKKGEQSVPFLPYRAYNLLAFLLLRENLPVSRERLGSIIYGSLPEDKMRGRISDHLWLIRKHLPGFPIISSKENIGLDKSGIWLDVKEFEKEIASSDDPLSERFITLYGGELLPELYEEWVLVERERWRNHYLRRLNTLIEHLLVAKKYKHAITRIHELLREEPYDEGVVRLLMQAYVKIGRRGAALAAYEKFYRLSVEQIGLEPDESTTKIYEAIKSTPVTPGYLLSPEHDHLSSAIVPEEILNRAQTAMERGNRDELRELLDSLPTGLSPETAFRMDLLSFDEKIMWGEFDQAEKVLSALPQSNPHVQVRKARLAFVQHDYQGAMSLAEEALRQAQQRKLHKVETHALIMISASHSVFGEKEKALLLLDRAIAIAERIDDSVALLLAMMYKGEFRSTQGFGESARETLAQAEKIARTRKFMPLLARVLDALGTNANYYGDYQSSLKYLLESLELSRDLNLWVLEAKVLLALSGTYDYLGRYTETTEAMKNASRIYKERQDDMGMAKCYYNLALNIPTVDEKNIDEAIKYAQKALDIFLENKSLGWVASSHTALGYCQWLAGLSNDALKNFKSAIAIHTKLDEQRFIPENYAYIGLVYNQLNKSREALTHTQFAIQELTYRNLSDISAEIYFAHATVLRSLGEIKDAGVYVGLGYEVLQDTAKDIEDEEARIAYFQRDPITRRLMALAYEYGIAPKPKTTVVSHTLPGSGRHRVDMVLILDAGAADQALQKAKGSTELRRARLKRILKDGEVHGLRLTIKELAMLFNVSPRTIHRDINVIKEAAFNTPQQEY